MSSKSKTIKKIRKAIGKGNTLFDRGQYAMSGEVTLSEAVSRFAMIFPQWLCNFDKFRGTGNVEVTRKSDNWRLAILTETDNGVSISLPLNTVKILDDLEPCSSKTDSTTINVHIADYIAERLEQWTGKLHSTQDVLDLAWAFAMDENLSVNFSDLLGCERGRIALEMSTL